MPAATYNYTAATYQISCNHCDTTVYTDSPYRADAFVTGTDRRVSDTFSFSANRSSFRGTCRSCARSRRSPRTVGRRVVGTFLGLGRKYGVELELIFPSGVGAGAVRDALAAAGVNGWDVKYDGSLRGNGLEVVSPPLTGEAGLREIDAACAALNALGATVNPSCGMHVHHDISDLTIDDVKRVARGWKANANLIDGLVAPSRRYNGSTQYCARLSEQDMQQIDRCDTISDLRHLSVGRYRSLNLTAYGRYGTIEIRQHQGTCNAEKIKTWVRFGQAIIDSAKQGEIAERTTVRDLLSTLGDRLDETARTFLLGRAVEFGAVAV